MELGLGEGYTAENKICQCIYAFKCSKGWKHMVNKDDVAFLSLQFRVNKTALLSFQQINQSTQVQ